MSRIFPDHIVPTNVTEAAQRGLRYTAGFREARQQGANAFRAPGVEIYDNPHVGEKKVWWVKGWREAEAVQTEEGEE